MQRAIGLTYVQAVQVRQIAKDGVRNCMMRTSIAAVYTTGKSC